MSRFAFLACSAALLLAASARAQLRIVDYNTGGDARAGIGTILAAIGAENVNGVSKAPDVLTLQEQSSAATTQAIVNILNGLYGAGTYAMATVQGGTTGAGRPALIYNTQAVQLVATTTASTLSSSGAARQTMRYELRPAGYDATADFYVYVSHYKASNTTSDANRRNGEAVQVRANADALGEGANLIFTGDFNIYKSSEPMWTTLTAPGAGQAFDPVNRVGNWSNNASFTDVHTQSPATVSAYGGQVTGGMDDRFDFQLVSGELLDGEGLSYMPGSYHAFGNTNTHAMNGAITTGSAAVLAAQLPGYTNAQATAVLQALTVVSDHLPVVAQYQLPAKMGVIVGAIPSRLIVGASAGVEVTVSNTAPVLVAAGADELDYTLDGGGALSGDFAGSEAALGGGEAHSLTLSTASVGLKSGVISAASSSQGAANANFSQPVSYAVVDHAKPLFVGTDEIVLTLSFGVVPQFSEPAEITLSLANWVSGLGMNAALDLDTITSSSPGAISTDLVQFFGLEAGGVVNFHVLLASDTPGLFSTTFTLAFSDEDIPGAASAGTLTVNVSGEVAAVPEPSISWLLLAGLAIFALRGIDRRRRFPA